FQFGVGYSFNVDGSQDWDVDGATDPNEKGLTTGLRYANGPIGAALTYDQVDTDVADAKVKAWNVGLSYDFEVVKLHAGFGQTKDGWIGAYNYGSGLATSWNLYEEGLEANLYTVGVSAPLGAGKVM